MLTWFVRRKLSLSCGSAKHDNGCTKELEEFARRRRSHHPSWGNSLLSFVSLQTMNQVDFKLGRRLVFSALLMAEQNCLIENHNNHWSQWEMIGFAKENFCTHLTSASKSHFREWTYWNISRATLWLDFMDSAKSERLHLSSSSKRLEIGGWWFLDDIFKGEMWRVILWKSVVDNAPSIEVCNVFFLAHFGHPGLTASLIPLGIGILMIRKWGRRLFCRQKSSF